jgi:hypothetical protein
VRAIEIGGFMMLLTARPSQLLRRALIADAAITGATGLALLAAAGPLAALFGLPDQLLRYAGVSLLPFAAFVGALSGRESISLTAVRVVIAANALWVVDSLLLLVTGWVDPSVLGYAFVIGQALIVAAFAELQYAGLKTSPA